MVTQPIANDAATDIFADLDPKSIALLLDVDGTLIDIGPSPHEVHVSDELRDSLARLSRLTGGALALVSGRPIADLDRAVRAAQAAGDRRPWRRDARARRRSHQLGATPLPTGSAPAPRRRGDAGLGHRRRGQGLFAGAALPQRAAARRPPARAYRGRPRGVSRLRRPKCCRARPCSRSSGRASAKATACAR